MIRGRDPLDLYARMTQRRNEIMEVFPRQFEHYDAHPLQRFEWPKGWNSLVYFTCYDVDKRFPAQVRWTQIQEKFGELRMYFSVNAELRDVYAFVSQMTKRSLAICMSCEAPGSRYDSDGWLLTLCRRCAGLAKARRD